jgi:hypothetical protein
MKKILIFLSLIIWTNVFPQITFQRTYGGDNHDQGWDVIQLSDSSYVIAGGSRSFGNTNADFYLIKVNKYGDLLWQKTYGGSENDFCYSFEKTLDKGFILAGSTSSFGALEGDYYFVKVDSMGNFEWQQNLISSNYDRLNDVFQSQSHRFLTKSCSL